MTYRRRVNAQIERFGREVTVYTRTSTKTNSFGNTEWEFTDDPDGDGVAETVLAYRTYDSRNTEVQGNVGDRHRDAPIFLFPLGQVPDADARIEYPEPDGIAKTMYELHAPTRYETHVEIPAEVVTNDNSGTVSVQ